MRKIRIGVLGTADIAYRRFIPALLKAESFEYCGVAIADYMERGEGFHEKSYAPILEEKKKKAAKFTDSFGGKVYIGYGELLKSGEADAVYIPLPPSLHYKWSCKALSHGKHVLSEKPCTMNSADTRALIDLADQKNLVINENYAFTLHKQIECIKDIIESGKIGEIRLIRSSFGFPYRSAEDFRYNKAMGGGALLDCGGYTLKAASIFMKKDITVISSLLKHTDAHDVDMYGSIVVRDGENTEAQLAFGMDNAYKCDLEIWGSKAAVTAPRIFTPPPDMGTQILIKGQSEEVIKIVPDDQFLHAIENFGECIENTAKYERAKEEILRQSRLMEESMEEAVIKSL